MPQEPPALSLNPFETFEARKESRKHLLGFSLIYLTGYFTDPPATFHAQLVHALASDKDRRLLIIGFRGSGKSTLGSLALPLWAALEYPEKYPFIILISDSARQATLNIAAIKTELETNNLIKQDYGEIKGNVIEDFSLKGDGEEWQKQNIVLSNGVRILARSRGQKVRGLRHLQYRPKLVVIDDPEDGEWVRTKENRDKTERWLRSEVIPGMDARKGKLVLIGNLLHMDALLSRLKTDGSGFKVLEFPLIDKDGRCTWPAMYPTEQSLKDRERDMGPVAWAREMLLKIVAEEDQIIKPEDIHYYDEWPKEIAAIKGHGIDLAISQKENADYTSIVSGEVFYIDNAPKIFVRPNPYNAHVLFHNFLQKVRNIPGDLGGANLFFVEDVAYQKAAIQEMERSLLPVIPMKPQGDKRARLQVVAPYIKNGTVLFPRTGCEELLGQMFNLGVESHDDLCLDGDTLVLTNDGEKPIRDISAGEFVMTRQGYKRVLWAGQTGLSTVITRFGLTGTPNHPVITMMGTTRLDSLEPNAMVYAWRKGRIRVCALSRARPAKNHLQGILDQIDRRITDFARGIVARLRMYEISAKETKGISLARQHGANWPNELGSRIDADGTILLFDMRTWIGNILRRMFSTTTGFITAVLNLSAARIESISGITIARASRRSLFTGNSGSITTAPSTDSPTFITKMETRLIIPSRILKRKTNEIIWPNTCVSRSGSLWRAGQSRPLKQQPPSGIDRQKDLHGIVNMPGSKDSARSAVVPVYNLLVEDAHEFFANGILVHNCDALVYLIQGLVSQGLDLPKIHWIET